jgi:hypothetical protein
VVRGTWCIRGCEGEACRTAGDERLGGVLEVESVPGSGTTIHTRIPARRMEIPTSDGCASL